MGRLARLLRLVKTGNIGAKFNAARKASPGELGTLAVHGAGFALGLLMLPSTPPEHRGRALLENIVSTGVGIAVPGAGGFVLSAAVSAAFSGPEIGRGIVHGLRHGMEQRTMLSVPFSYQQTPIHQAESAMRYAHQTMNSAYSSIPNEAGMMAARYLSR